MFIGNLEDLISGNSEQTNEVGGHTWNAKHVTRQGVELEKKTNINDEN